MCPSLSLSFIVPPSPAWSSLAAALGAGGSPAHLCLSPTFSAAGHPRTTLSSRRPGRSSPSPQGVCQAGLPQEKQAQQKGRNSLRYLRPQSCSGLDRAFQNNNGNAPTKPTIIPTACSGARIQGKTPLATQNPILQHRSCSTDPSHHRSRRELLPGMLLINPLTFSTLSFFLSNSLLSSPLLPLPAALGSVTGDLRKLSGCGRSRGGQGHFYLKGEMRLPKCP